MAPAKIGRALAAVKTVKDSVECPMPKLNGYGEQSKKVEAMIAANIYALDSFLRLKNGLTQDEVFFTAESIMEEFGWVLTFADVNIVFTKAKRGGYGQFYERLSCAQIMDWFRQYADERMDEAERWSYHKDVEAARERERYEPKERDPEMMAELRRIVGGKVITKGGVDDGEYRRYKIGMIKSGYKLPSKTDGNAL